MDEVARLLTLLALAGGALTLLGGACVWFLDEERRIRRSLTKVLGAQPQAVLTARGRGKGAGFDFSAGAVAVTWDFGAWCLVYRAEELMGAELIVDGQVVARAHRTLPGRALDQHAEPEDRVRLRLIFDDPRWPDFEIDLWVPADEGRRGGLEAAEALHEANRWIGRVEALLRRPAPPRPAAKVAVERPPEPAAPPPWADDEADDAVEDDEPQRALT